MINKITLLILVVALLSGCDGGAPPKAATAISNATNISAAFPAVYASLPKKAGGACGFDQPKSDGDNQFISGWAAISVKDGALAEAIVLGIKASNGDERFVITSKQSREDVAKYFSNATLADSGFSAYIKEADAPKGSVTKLYQVFQGNIYTCDVSTRG